MSAIDPLNPRAGEALYALQNDLPMPVEAQRSSYRWIVLMFAWGALLLSFVDRLAWSSLAVSVGESLGLAIAALGSFVTAFYVGYVASNLGGGFLTDVLGPRKTLALSLLPLGLCTLLFGHVTSVPIGLLMQALMGLAAGCDYSACIKLTTAWFDVRQRGRAMGILMTATSLAVIITNFVVPRLLKVQSWGDIYQDLGIVTATFGLVCLVVVRDGPLAAKQVREPIDIRAMLRNRDLVLLAIAGFGAMWGTWGFTFWANALMIKGHGFSTAAAGSITVLFGIGAIVSKPLIGLLSDWLGGRRKILVMGCFVCFTILLLVYGLLDTEQSFRIVAPLLGVAAFAYSPLTAAMVAEIAGKSIAGSATGATNAFWQLGSVTVPLVVGAVFQSSHSFMAAFVTLALGPLFAAIGLTFVREIKRF
jgi:sugar phosphate permease